MTTLVERHEIKENNPNYTNLIDFCHRSKNLYNRALYDIRQAFLFEGKDKFSTSWLYQRIKLTDPYKELPRKVSQQVLFQVLEAWTAFTQLMKVWNENPERLNSKPRPPKYLDKNRVNVVRFDVQSFSKTAMRKGYFKMSGLDILIPTKITNIKGGRIVPKRNNKVVIEIIYERELEENNLNMNLVAGIDLGLDNLATLTSNKTGFTPIVVNGRPLKSINQFYNKEKARLQSILPEGIRWSKKLDKLTDKRNKKIDKYLHTASRKIVNKLVDEGIGVLIVGYNKDWKQGINLGKKTNQNFVNIPFYKFRKLLEYKCHIAGIELIMQEESYTSKCSFLDDEPICKHEEYIGKRTKRGLFKSGNGTIINADVNGSYNIIKKAIPDAFAEGIEDVAVHPIRVTFL